MPHIFLAFTNPAGASEDPFNTWYNERHVPEVLRYGRGFTGCRRYRLESGARAAGLTPWRYLALYDVDTDDLALLARKPFRDGAPPLTPFRGLVEEDHVGWVYTPRTPGILPAQPYADCLVLTWHTAPLSPEQVAAASDAVKQSQGSLAARAYEKAANQRASQQDAPWPALVIYETSRPEAAPQSQAGRDAWTYVAVADYVRRDPS